MNVPRIVRNTVLTVVGLIVLLVIAVGLILLLGLNVNLNALRAPIAEAASNALGRQFRIDGDVSLEASLWPALSVESVSISNAEGFSGTDFASLDEMRLQVGVLPLLERRIHVRELVADGVEVNLESDTNGNSNWSFGSGAAANRTAGEEKAPVPEQVIGDGPGVTFEVDALAFSNISANYVDDALGRSLQFELEKFAGSAGSETPLELDIAGAIQEVPFSFGISGPSLSELEDLASVSPIAISGELSGTPIDVAAQYGHDGKEPTLVFGVVLGATDIGGVFSWLGVAEGMDLTTEEFSVDVALRGNSLDELARNSEFSADLTGGHWQTTSSDGSKGKSISIKKGRLAAGPAQPMNFTVSGVLDRTPVTIRTSGALLVDYVKRDRPLPISFGVDFADVTLDLSGNLTVPIRQGPFDMDLNLSGDNLTTFNESLGLDLPPLGPYRIEGRYAADDRGFRLNDLVIGVGESELNGQFDFDRTQQPPRLGVTLTAPRLQLNDFDLKGWSAEGGAAADETAEAETEEQAGPTDSAEQPGETFSLLSSEALNSVNARFDLDVEEVMSGEEVIGKGQLVVELENGRLTIHPLHLTVPGGSVDVEFGYHPVPGGVELYLKTLVDRFDYGVLARRVDPDTKMGGKIFLDVDVKATAESVDGLMQGGNGHFDFALLPVKFDASIFDLWAVNLLSALSKKVDDAPESVINCILARLTLEEGIMQDRVIFMDTTRMSVLGKAKIDFNQASLDVYAKPEAKWPEFFSVAVPVGVSGEFEDWGLDIGILPATWAGVSFATSPVHVPIRRLFAGDPLEGEAACRQAWLESEKPPEEPKAFESKAFQ